MEDSILRREEDVEINCSFDYDNGENVIFSDFIEDQIIEDYSKDGDQFSVNNDEESGYKVGLECKQKTSTLSIHIYCHNFQP